MIHTTFGLDRDLSEDEMIDAIAFKLPYAAAKALPNLDMDWQTPSAGLMSTTGCHFLWRHYEGVFLDQRPHPDGLVMRYGGLVYQYKLTLLGLKLKNSLVRQGIS